MFWKSRRNCFKERRRFFIKFSTRKFRSFGQYLRRVSVCFWCRIMWKGWLIENCCSIALQRAAHSMKLKFWCLSAKCYLCWLTFTPVASFTVTSRRKILSVVKMTKCLCWLTLEWWRNLLLRCSLPKARPTRQLWVKLVTHRSNNCKVVEPQPAVICML